MKLRLLAIPFFAAALPSSAITPLAEKVNLCVDAVGPPSDRDQSTLALTPVALVGAPAMAAAWAAPHYQLQGTASRPSFVVVIVSLGSGIKVLAATSGAALCAVGRAGPALIRGLGALAFTAVTLEVLVLTLRPLVCVDLGYPECLATAGTFLPY